MIQYTDFNVLTLQDIQDLLSNSSYKASRYYAKQIKKDIISHFELKHTKVTFYLYRKYFGIDNDYYIKALKKEEKHLRIA